MCLTLVGSIGTESSHKLLAMHPLTRVVYAKAMAAGQAAQDFVRNEEAQREEASKRLKEEQEGKEAAEKAREAEERAKALERVVETLGDDDMKLGWTEKQVTTASVTDLLWKRVFGFGDWIEIGDGVFPYGPDDGKEVCKDVERVSIDAYRTLRSVKARLVERLSEPEIAQVGSDDSPLYTLERWTWDDRRDDDETCYAVHASVDIGGIILNARHRLT